MVSKNLVLSLVRGGHDIKVDIKLDYRRFYRMMDKVDSVMKSPLSEN